MTDDLRAFFARCGDDAINVFYKAAFHFEPQGELLCAGIGQLLQVRQCVKHGNMRDVPALRKLHGGYARQPVMAMQYIIVFASAKTKIINMLRESGQVIVEFVFMDGLSRPGVYVNDAHTRTKVDDVWSRFVGAAGENINVDMRLPQFASQLLDIDVHAASISCAPRHIQRGRMDAEHSDRITHTL